MNTHEQVELLARKKQAEQAETELKELAQKDIRHFIVMCKASGFRTGINTGFFIGVIFTLLVVFALK